MLWICLELPELVLEVFTRAEAPVTTTAAAPLAVASGGPHPCIVLGDRLARERGIRPGQLVSAALALTPDLRLRDRAPEAEAMALAGVATWLTRFTPMVSLVPPRAVLVEIGSSLRLFGGLAALRQDVAAGLAELGYVARCGVAPTPAAAVLFARAGQSVPVLRPAELDAALADVPLSASEADAGTLAMLMATGISTFGAACALPRAGLARRAGPAFVDWLDRTRGRHPDPRIPFVPPAQYHGKLDLPASITDVEALGFAVKRLVQELSGWLQGRGQGVLEVFLVLTHERHLRERTGAPATELRLALAAPTRAPAHLMGVLRERLARVELAAPAVGIELRSTITAPLAGRNRGLLPDDVEPADVPLLDRLRARLGEDALVRIAPRAEHRPERAWHRHAPAPAAAARAGGTPPGATRTTGPSAPRAPRPLWLLREPQPLAVDFETRPWILCDGPERIESGWWDGEDIRRDYFVAENPQGALLWIYRDSRCGDDGEWFLHGVFA